MGGTSGGKQRVFGFFPQMRCSFWGKEYSGASSAGATPALTQAGILQILEMKRQSITTVALLVFSTHAVTARAEAFERDVSLQGVSYHVSADMKRPENTVTIKPQGLKASNRPIKRVIFGTVTGVEVADLNTDGSPEVFVFYTSDGSGSYGGLLGFSANNKKSMSEIFLPDLMDDKKASQGYMGHDEFTIVESRLGRRFPLYRSGDANNNPTGGTRVIFYKLMPGEAGWKLVPDETQDYPQRGVSK